MSRPDERQILASKCSPMLLALRYVAVLTITVAGCNSSNAPESDGGPGSEDGGLITFTDSAPLFSDAQPPDAPPDCTNDDTCKTPPDDCHNRLGRCVGGTCIYTQAEPDTPCNDGDACTTGGRCDDSGRCIGNPIPCDSPPAAEVLAGAKQIISYSSPGTCTAGECIYPKTEFPCPEAGCGANPCTYVTCSAPEESCFAGAGSCVAGNCRFDAAMTGVDCNDHDVCTPTSACNEVGWCIGEVQACTDAPNDCREPIGHCAPNCGSPGDPCVPLCEYAEKSDATRCLKDTVVGSCLSGQCVTTTCLINAERIPAGQAKPGTACQRCDPTKDQTRWSDSPDGRTCSDSGPGGICLDGSCDYAHCLIDNVVREDGQALFTNKCKVCVVDENRRGWTQLAEGSKCDNDQGACDAQGTCAQDGCGIAGVYYAEDAVDPENPDCRWCQSGTYRYRWTNRPNGRPCETGSCENGACAPVPEPAAFTVIYHTYGIGPATFTVPDNVWWIKIEAWGAGGGGGAQASPNASGGSGGGGALATSVLNVTPGQLYNVYVGGGGDQPLLPPGTLTGGTPYRSPGPGSGGGYAAFYGSGELVVAGGGGGGGGPSSDGTTAGGNGWPGRNAADPNSGSDSCYQYSGGSYSGHCGEAWNTPPDTGRGGQGGNSYFCSDPPHAAGGGGGSGYGGGSGGAGVQGCSSSPGEGGYAGGSFGSQTFSGNARDPGETVGVTAPAGVGHGGAPGQPGEPGAVRIWLP